jgi:hypothetical protein
MPAVPSEEASAHYILAILLGYHWIDKTIVSVNNFALPLVKRGLRDSDFNRGIQYAVEMGWVKITIPKSFRLTDTGFAEACAITAEKTRPRREAAN